MRRHGCKIMMSYDNLFAFAMMSDWLGVIGIVTKHQLQYWYIQVSWAETFKKKAAS